MRLTNEQIEKLASRQGARRIAVENFLGTIDSMDGLGAVLCNMRADARSYNWNALTVEAIRRGIELLFGGR